MISTFIQFGDDQVSSVLGVGVDDPEAELVHSQVQVGVGVQAVGREATGSWEKSAVRHRAVQQVHL